jgi:hypothetical protein
MSVIFRLMPSFMKSWRVSLLATFIIAGVVLSCSTACFTTEIIPNFTEAVGNAHDRLAVANGRTISVPAFFTVLPPPNPGVPSADRLKVTEQNYIYVVTAVGEFTEQNATALRDTARRLIYSHSAPINTRFEIHAYREVDHSRALVAEFTVDRADDAQAELRQALPPANPRTPEEGRLRVNFTYDGKILYVVAIGDFTTKAKTTFIEAVRKLQKNLPKTVRVLVWMKREAEGTHGREIVGHYDSDARGDPR